MCGVAGILRLDGQVADPGTARAMAMLQAHRGPDDEGLWAEGPIALAHRRLSIIGLDSSGHQPLSNEDGSVLVSFNGEIYNYAQVREELRDHGHRFRSSTDTEVLVHAYEEWGPWKFLDRLNGIFGLALWDNRQHRLVLARDRLGVKRMYVQVSARQLAFASEIRALAAARSTEPAMDMASLDAYFALGYVPEPGTIWEGVSCLAPGCVQVWQYGRPATRAYWRLQPGMRSAPRSFAECTELVRHEFRQAVRRQMVSDVPIGVCLSGGVDSAGILALAAQVASEPPTAFSIGFQDPAFDELPSATLAARQLGARHLTRVVQPNVLELATQLARQYGQPFADSSAIGVALVSELAAEHVKVVLCGDGGDEVFGGYPTYSASQLVPLYQALPRTARAWLGHMVGQLPVGSGKVTASEKARRFIAAANLPAPTAHLYWRQYFSAGERARLLGRKDPTYSPVLLESLLKSVLEKAEVFPGLDRYLAMDVLNYLPSDMLCKVDVASMRSSVEARLPLLDHELVEVAFSLPPGVKRRGASGKRVLRAALEGLVPAPLLRARKQGFNVPLAAWMAGPLRPALAERLRPGGSPAMELMDCQFAATLLDEHGSGAADHAYKLWTLLMFCLWYEQVPDDLRPMRTSASPLERRAA